MKHLRKYNEEIQDDYMNSILYSLSKQQIDDINDICLEIKDIGYQAYLFTTNEYPLLGFLEGTHQNLLKIYKGTPVEDVNSIIGYKEVTARDWTYYDEIQEVIERIQDYLTPQGFSVRGEHKQTYYCLWITKDI